MDYIFDLLVEKLDVESTLSFSIKKPHPDQFRHFLFDKTDKIIFTDEKLMPSITSTKKKYWKNNYNFDDTFTKMINLYDTLQPHSLTDSLINNYKLPDIIKNYYKKFYDIADIIIIKSNKENKLLSEYMAFLLSFKKNIIIIRITFYLSIFFIKERLGRNTTSPFIKTFLNKINEFRSIPQVSDYFTQIELESYFCYVKDLEKKNRDLLEKS